MRILPVVVVVDVDPDWRSPGLSGKPYLGELAWKGITDGVPRMIKRLKPLENGSGTRLRFTWLVRSDDQMATLRGDPAAFASEQEEFLKNRIALGDTVGWHPHLWRFSERRRVWYQETTDVDWIRQCLKEGHSALSRRFPIRVAKTGWTFHTNFTMRLFSDLGVDVDVSAIPGMHYHGTVPGTDLPLGLYDWSRAPQEPYHPSEQDYQAPGNRKALKILEVPNWTFPLGIARGLFHKVRHRAQRDFANQAKHPRLARGAFTRPPKTLPFVCYFHPEELLGESAVFSASYIPTNIKFLIQAASRNRLEAKPMTASEVVGLSRWYP